MIRQIVLGVLPDVTPEAVAMTTSLRDLGANSMDRAEVATCAIEQLHVVVPLAELAQVADLGGLVDLIHRHMAGGRPAAPRPR